MSDCSRANALSREAYENLARTCGTCLWFAKEPFKRHAGACLNYPERGKYTQASDVQDCKFYQPRTDSLEQVARDMYGYIDAMLQPGERTRWDGRDGFKQRLRDCGIEVE